MCSSMMCRPHEPEPPKTCAKLSIDSLGNVSSAPCGHLQCCPGLKCSTAQFTTGGDTCFALNPDITNTQIDASAPENQCCYDGKASSCLECAINS